MTTPCDLYRCPSARTLARRQEAFEAAEKRIAALEAAIRFALDDGDHDDDLRITKAAYERLCATFPHHDSPSPEAAP